MDKQAAVFLYSGILLSTKDEWYTQNTNQSQNNCAEWKKLDKNKYLQYDSIYIKLWKTHTNL